MSKSNDSKSKETDDKKAADQDSVQETGAEGSPESVADTAADTVDGAEDATEEILDIPVEAEADEATEELDPAPEADMPPETDGLDADVSLDMPEAALDADDTVTADAEARQEESRVFGDASEPEVHEPAPAAAPTTVIEQKGGFWPMALGGVVAAVLGYGAAWYLGQNTDFETETRAALDLQSTTLQGLEGQIGDLAAQGTTTSDALSSLTTDIAAAQESIAAVQGELTAMGDRVSSVEGYGDQIAALDARLTDLAKRPIEDNVSREAIDAYEEELERLRNSMEEQRKAIEDTIAAEKAKIEKIAEDATQMEERALEEARIAAARSAVTRVLSALDNGDPFEEALAELAENVEDPLDTLQSVAAEGVVTQAALRERFPDAARDALRAARNGAPAEEDDGGIGGILEKMFEVRSTEPREGDDPDAVLSRAEASVRNGDLRTALTEIEALPEVAKEALSPWVTDATTRLAALDEAQAVAARLNQG